jgi:MFS transporter, DHA1 family, tetracycline resistance protein
LRHHIASVIAQAFAIGPVIRWLGERGTLLLGIACETIALLVLALAQTDWIAFAPIPLIAFGGIGAPALRSMQTNAVDHDRQGSCITSFVSLGGDLRPTCLQLDLRSITAGMDRACLDRRRGDL